MFSFTTAKHIYCTNFTVCKLNCTYSNYTEAAATCSAAQQHSTFTVQILYKLYSLQLNSTDSNYTEAAATCSASQQQNTFTVQTLQSANWTVLTVIIRKLLLYIQLQIITETVKLISSEVQCNPCRQKIIPIDQILQEFQFPEYTHSNKVTALCTTRRAKCYYCVRVLISRVGMT